ncbi:hypothetical protein BT96DRAFT_915962, partial [Gymnopus androsaceus JB14]
MREIQRLQEKPYRLVDYGMLLTPQKIGLSQQEPVVIYLTEKAASRLDTLET